MRMIEITTLIVTVCPSKDNSDDSPKMREYNFQISEPPGITTQSLSAELPSSSVNTMPPLSMFSAAPKILSSVF